MPMKNQHKHITITDEDEDDSQEAGKTFDVNGLSQEVAKSKQNEIE